MSIGYRIFTKRKLPPDEIVQKFRDIHTANVADCLQRLCVLSPEINLLSGPTNACMIGTAVTVKSRDGDNRMIHEAIDLAGEGDIIVVSNEGGRKRALIGENMCHYMMYRKIEGVVLDGPVRDIDEIRKMNWNIFGTGYTPAGPTNTGPGEVNVPISCGGVMVNPGDIIIGDSDGVIVVPRQEAGKVLEAAAAYSKKDAQRTKDSIAGTIDRKWVKELWKTGELEIIEEAYSDDI